MAKIWRIAGLSFDHMHMGDLLRQVHEHPRAEVAGICDDDPQQKESVERAVERFEIPRERVYRDYRRCLEEVRPDIVIVCSATARHAEFVEMAAPYQAHILVEKPFAASLAEADRMIKAVGQAGTQMVVNWPLAWYPPHRTAKRLLDEGAIGSLCEVHYYDGNRGPTRHLAQKEEVPEAEAVEAMKRTWWYRKDAGGGSLLDYLGYGVTLGTWYHGGDAPIAVCCTTWARKGLEVDEHSLTAARYAGGLSKFETRWGTFTDPWAHQPQPKCGFVLVGSEGTISSYDYEERIRVQTSDFPEGREFAVDVPEAPMRGPVEHLIDVLENGTPVHGPLSIPICRTGQRIVDAALRSAESGREVGLESV